MEALVAVARRAQELLDAVGRTCLVHSDLNPKNLLVDPDTLAVTGVLDWEFAHSGHPATDLGNLLRFDRHPAYAGAVVSAWCDRHGSTPAEALDLARAADLWALVDLAAARGRTRWPIGPSARGGHRTDRRSARAAVGRRLAPAAVRADRR